MIKIDAKNVDFYYGDFHALKNISMEIEPNTSTAFIGPSGCGKSTFLRLFNRMNDLIPGTRMEGQILIDGRDIYTKSEKVDRLRKNVGMVFQKPNPFPKTIYENVAYGLRVNGVNDENYIEETVVKTLKQVVLWDEVKDKLKESAFALSGGQQQRFSQLVVNEEQLPDIPDEAGIAETGGRISEEMLMAFVAELPDGCRTVFNLYVFEEKSHKEIAEILHIKEHSSTSQLHRAKCLLIKRIKEYTEYERK